MRRKPLVSSFSDHEIKNAITAVMGARPTWTPSLRVLRNVGAHISYHYKGKGNLVEVIEQGVQQKTGAIQRLDDNGRRSYVEIAKNIISSRGSRPAARELRRTAHPQSVSMETVPA